MKKYLSDIDTINGKPTVEWEWESGERTWEEFDTEAQREAVIEANTLANEAEDAAEQEANYLVELMEEERFLIYDSLYY